ncbi:MAG TPA: PD-(D/E)XK nuclease family protein, partial [Microlunatus sp.]
ARRVLIGSGHNWRPELIKPRQPSRYLQMIMAEAVRQQRLLHQAAAAGEVNPHDSEAPPVPWPRPLDPEALDRRRHAAEMVRAARRRHLADGSYASPPGAEEPLLLDDEETVAAWDADIERLLAESIAARRGAADVVLPVSLSATELIKLRADAGAYAGDLARPMPRRPSRRQRFGTRFHQWIERRLGTRMLTESAWGQPQLVDPDELADRADLDVDGEAEFRELCERFAAGQFGDSHPSALEAPFTLVLGDRVIRGRIDAVYRIDDGPVRYRIVDWKTSPGQSHDPLQLAIYRTAWAELSGVTPDQVDAVFYSVPEDRIITPTRLASREELERILTAVPQATALA